MVRPNLDGSPGLLVVVYSLIGIAAAATAVSLLGPNVDLAIARLMFDPQHGFTGGHNPYLAALRDHGMVAVVTCLICVALAFTRYLPWRLPGLRARTATFLVLALLIGPGLLVNGILKPFWGRPRPFAVTEFGGLLRFVDWWNPTGACAQNCSFASGEAATAAWMFGPAMLVPPPWRGLAILAAAMFTTTMSSFRMAAGAHFFTDTVIGALSTVLILLAMRALIDPQPAPVGRDPARAAAERVPRTGTVA